MERGGMERGRDGEGEGWREGEMERGRDGEGEGWRGEKEGGRTDAHRRADQKQFDPYLIIWKAVFNTTHSSGQYTGDGST